MNLVEKFRCQEYLGEKYKTGLYHPEEAWEIYGNHNCFLSEDGKLLIIGQTFDEYQMQFCYHSSHDGIWTLASNGKISKFADRLHDMVEGWHFENDNAWGEMDNISRWKSTHHYLQHHHIHYNWDIQTLIGCIQRWTELGLNRLTSITAEKNHLSISLENSNSGDVKKRTVFIGMDTDSNKYRVSFLENDQKVSSAKVYETQDLTQYIEKIHGWLTS